MKLFIIIKRFWWLLAIILIAGGLFFYNSRATKAKEIKTKTYKVTRQDLVDALDISGQVDAHEKATLQFQTSGLLAWVGVKEGDYVKKFQVLASLDKKQLQNQMSQLLNTYMTNRWNFEQTQSDNKNWQTNGMTDVAREAVKRTVEKTQFSLNNAVLAVEAENLTMRFVNLWTPIEGLVTGIDTPNSGVNVTPASANFMIVNPKTIYFSAVADQTEVTKLKVGSRGTVTLDSFPDKKIEGMIESIGFTPKAGETGTVYEVKIGLGVSNLDYAIRMGMTGDINFVFKEIKNVLTVPTAYITTEENKKYVEVVVGDTKNKTEITTGDTIDGLSEILTGLKENDLIYSN